MTNKQANTVLLLCWSVNIIAICVRNHLPIIDLVTIIVMVIAAILYSLLIGRQDK